MRKIVDDVHTIYKCCSLYYEDEMSQQQICDYLGISRATVSRMLKAGREQGMVRIEVIDPNPASYKDMERRLVAQYGLKDAVIVASSVLDSKNEIATYLSETAADYLDRHMQYGEHIGVSMGTTLHSITQIKKPYAADRDLTFVPIVGGIGMRRMARTDIQSNEVAEGFARMYGGRYLQFLSPAIFSDRDVLNGFLQEKTINYIFDYFQKLSTIICGIGTPGDDSTLVSYGYLAREDMQRMMDAGAAGDMALRFFNIEGSTRPFEDLNSRIASMPLDAMLAVGNRIGVVSGSKKVRAVKGAIRSGMINILITDLSCAEALIEGE